MRESIEFDYLILGAGSAGCVLANELSASGENTVLLLEAGPVDNKLLIHVPAGVYSAYRDPSINWNYLAEPDAGVENRQIELPRGKVFGGSSSINSMVYMRGHPRDYDDWARISGLEEWRFENCLPYFKHCESSDRGGSAWRGDQGRLGVTKGKLENPLFDALLLAGEQSGQGISEDLNGYKPEGIARLDSTVRNGRRCSAAVAHLRPALSRKNLTVLSNALIHRIVLDGSCARSVEYDYRGEVRTAHAAKGIVVCTGAIKSPQLLMLSGIGPGDELKEHGIDVSHHLPGVGQNLQDHPYIHTAFYCKKPVSLDYLTRPLSKLSAGLQWLLTRKGVAASNIWEMGGLVYGNDQATHPNLQYHFTPVYSEYTGRKIRLFQGYQIHVDQLRPQSRGHVSLISDNPADRPAAKFNYLSDEFDVNELVEAHHTMQELMAQPAFDEFRGERITPAPELSSRADIESYIRSTVSTDYHPCGTCKMGTDDESVVDPQLKVHGLENLFVVDASVMPNIVSGNLNAPTQMIAYRAADYILGRQQLAPERPEYHFDQ